MCIRDRHHPPKEETYSWPRWNFLPYALTPSSLQRLINIINRLWFNAKIPSGMTFLFLLCSRVIHEINSKKKVQNGPKKTIFHFIEFHTRDRYVGAHWHSFPLAKLVQRIYKWKYTVYITPFPDTQSQNSITAPETVILINDPLIFSFQLKKT